MATLVVVLMEVCMSTLLTVDPRDGLPENITEELPIPVAVLTALSVAGVLEPFPDPTDVGSLG